LVKTVFCKKPSQANDSDRICGCRLEKFGNLIEISPPIVARQYRSSWSQAGAAVSGAVLVNGSALERRHLVHTTTVAIACAARVHALLLGSLSGREGVRSKVGIARIEASTTQRQRNRDEEGSDDKGPLAAFHGSTAFGSMSGHEFTS
jgi:hypothetical protein